VREMQGGTPAECANAAVRRHDADARPRARVGSSDLGEVRGCGSMRTQGRVRESQATECVDAAERTRGRVGESQRSALTHQRDVAWDPRFAQDPRIAQERRIVEDPRIAQDPSAQDPRIVEDTTGS